MWSRGLKGVPDLSFCSNTEVYEPARRLRVSSGREDHTLPFTTDTPPAEAPHAEQSEKNSLFTPPSRHAGTAAVRRRISRTHGPRNPTERVLRSWPGSPSRQRMQVLGTS